MALRKPKDGNLALLIKALASAYHRGPDGQPRIQPISFRAKGISSATLHLWVHNGVENVTPRKMKILADAYGFDFPTIMAFIYGPPSRMEGDELLAALRRPRPISGGSHGDPGPSVVGVVDTLCCLSDAVRRAWRRWAWPLLPPLCLA